LHDVNKKLESEGGAEVNRVSNFKSSLHFSKRNKKIKKENERLGEI